jgi:membrane-bound lytic murein transglycosylase A
MEVNRLYLRLCSGLLVLIFSVPAFAQRNLFSRDFTTPTELLATHDYPVFSDDYDFRDLETAIARQLKRFANQDLSGSITLGGHKYPLSKAPQSLNAFKQLIKDFQSCLAGSLKQKCYDDFNAAVKTKFNVFAPKLEPGDPRYGQKDNAFFTGYDTQPLSAKPKPQGEYRYPVYALPASKRDQMKTRGEIDFHGALKGKGLELFYTNDLYDLYQLHVEGGGYVTLDDNGKQKQFYVSYGGTNHQKWAFISRYMLDHGMITNPSIAAQRKYLDAHPEKAEEVYSSCPSFIYFEETSVPALGSDGVPVTDGRSIATDSSLYAFKGLLSYIDSRRPEETGNYNRDEEDKNKIPFIPFSRFFLDQDTGGAITGKARADIYFGKTQYALFAATYQSEVGRMYFLMLK